MKYTADELAKKLEEKAKTLREHGLTETDMASVAGGGYHCYCCGTTCNYNTSNCDTDEYSGNTHPEGCQNTCVASSPD